MAAIQTFLQKPFIRKVGGMLLADQLPRIRQKIGEDPAVALGGLSTFLAWLAGKLPAKVAQPVQAIVMGLGILGIKATVTPAAAPKVVVKALVPEVAAPITVKVPLVVPPKELVQNAIQEAVAKATSALRGAGKVVAGAR